MKNMLRRILCFLFTGLTVLCLAGCGEQNVQNVPTNFSLSGPNMVSKPGQPYMTYTVVTHADGNREFVYFMIIKPPPTCHVVFATKFQRRWGGRRTQWSREIQDQYQWQGIDGRIQDEGSRRRVAGFRVIRCRRTESDVRQRTRLSRRFIDRAATHRNARRQVLKPDPRHPAQSHGQRKPGENHAQGTRRRLGNCRVHAATTLSPCARTRRIVAFRSAKERLLSPERKATIVYRTGPNDSARAHPPDTNRAVRRARRRLPAVCRRGARRGSRRFRGCSSRGGRRCRRLSSSRSRSCRRGRS